MGERGEKMNEKILSAAEAERLFRDYPLAFKDELRDSHEALRRKAELAESVVVAAGHAMRRTGRSDKGFKDALISYRSEFPQEPS